MRSTLNQKVPPIGLRRFTDTPMKLDTKDSDTQVQYETIFSRKLTRDYNWKKVFSLSKASVYFSILGEKTC